MQINSGSAVRLVASKRPFLTNFRALANIISAICILAVDFRIFPRKFAKTEVFGYSLMDTGVGLFILANALVAPEARDCPVRHRTRFQETLTRTMKSCFQSCVPLLVLGLGRFLAVEYMEYQKHTTEYGVHWNFFITLAFVKLFTGMISSTIRIKYSLFSGIWILGMHEYIMSVKGVKAWVLSNAPRDDFISANREGLISIPGYIGLYFIGVAIGRLIHSTYRNSHAEYISQYNYKSVSVKLFGSEISISYNESVLLCVKLSLMSKQACIVTLICDTYFKISRRLANLGYCMWILTLTTMLLTMLLFIEIVLDVINYVAGGLNNESKTEKSHKNLRLPLKKNVESKDKEDEESVVKTSLEIFEAVNYNGLFFFLLSNIMTGFVNMLLRTLYVKQMVALTVLIVYMAVNIFLTLILYRFQIPIKF